MNKNSNKNGHFPDMEDALFLCQNILMEKTTMLFNIWGFTPNYKSASDGIMLDMLLKSMEEKDVSEQSHVKSANGIIRPRMRTEKG